MSATALDPHNYIESFRYCLPHDLHPSGMTVIHEWFADMHRAAEAGDMHEVKRLIGLVHDKVKQELLWELENEAACRPHGPRHAEVAP